MDADGQDSTAAVPAWLNGSAPAATATAEPQLVETAEPHWLRRAFSSVIMHHEHPRDIAAARDRWELVRTHHVDATVMDWEERQRAPIGKQQQQSKDVEEEPEPDWLSQASVSILGGKRARNSIAAMVLGEAKVEGTTDAASLRPESCSTSSTTSEARPSNTDGSSSTSRSWLSWLDELKLLCFQREK